VTPATIEQARAAKEKLAAMLASLPELRGIGIALLDVGFGVKVNLCARPAQVLPNEIDCVPIVIEVIGEIRPL
jgi:hypothetical protein